MSPRLFNGVTLNLTLCHPMAKHKICILGGTGFVGRRLAARLTEASHDIVILTRHRERHRQLLVLPTARVVEGDVQDLAFLCAQFKDRDAVINLVGENKY